MDQKTSIAREIILAIIIIALVLLPQLTGTTTVADDTAGLDENGCPMTTATLADLEAPGTKFGTLTIKEWENELRKRFPKGEFRHYNSMANLYAGLDAGEVDAALGFIDQRQPLAETHPNLAFIDEPFATIEFGFATQRSDKGQALCRELNQYLAEIKANGQYDALRKKWEAQDRDGDVMGKYAFSGEKGTLKVATGGLWTPMTFYIGEILTGEFIEIINGFCAARGYTPQYETVLLTSGLAGLAAGSYDICADSVTASVDRHDTICVTDTLMTDDYVIEGKPKHNP